MGRVFRRGPIRLNSSNNRPVAGQGYNYDLAGNVTMNATGMQFVYDAENHQTEARDAGGFVVGQYFYDGEGKRVKKISNTETTVFVYDGGGQLVAEYSTAGNTTASVKYLTQDHLGSPRVITDQNGAVISRTDFGAFGDETITPQRTQGLGYKPDNVRQDYTGYQKDDESGLEYAQARYYNPAHGRFTSIDPLTASASIRNPQTFNRYSYVLNSPYKFTDPLGLLSVSTGACGQFCHGGESGGGGGGVNPMGGGMFVLLRRDSAPVPNAHTNEAAEPAEATETLSHESAQTAQPATRDGGETAGGPKINLTSIEAIVEPPPVDAEGREKLLKMTVLATGDPFGPLGAELNLDGASERIRRGFLVTLRLTFNLEGDSIASFAPLADSQLGIVPVTVMPSPGADSSKKAEPTILRLSEDRRTVTAYIDISRASRNSHGVLQSLSVSVTGFYVDRYVGGQKPGEFRLNVPKTIVKDFRIRFFFDSRSRFLKK